MRPVKFQIAIDVYVEERDNQWIITDGVNLMNKKGEWERDYSDFASTVGLIKRTRFETAEGANYFYHKIMAEKRYGEE